MSELDHGRAPQERHKTQSKRGQAARFSRARLESLEARLAPGDTLLGPLLGMSWLGASGGATLDGDIAANEEVRAWSPVSRPLSGLGLSTVGTQRTADLASSTVPAASPVAGAPPAEPPAYQEQAVVVEPTDLLGLDQQDIPITIEPDRLDVLYVARRLALVPVNAP